ncbi:hypothetical protein H5410_055154 [Solanum commersonii]|uniref:Secreted protein n=1 Tax=Solanum commersonii TaxID=4109 RepID=A0A9J5WII1_SOLCO|nr:hypothetical protein H5410_055154 [Solanum commersonii]
MSILKLRVISIVMMCIVGLDFRVVLEERYVTDGLLVSTTEGDHICCQHTQYSVKPYSQQLILKRSSREASKRTAQCTKQRAAILKSVM